MKHIWLFLLFFFIVSYASFGQFNIPEIKNPDTTSKLSFDSSIEKLISKSKIVILFRSYSAFFSFDKEYRIISFGNDSEWHYNYFMSRSLIDSPQLSMIKMSQKEIRKVWHKLLQNKLFEIKNEVLNEEYCDGVIRDSHHYEFTIIKDGQYKRISYYAPEYYIKICPPSRQREQIINCASSFKKHCKKPYKIMSTSK